MKDILFNSHDIILMLAAGLSLVLAARAATSNTRDRAPRTLLAVFFLLNACVSIDTLLFWGDSVKFAAFTLNPWLPMVFAFASFAVGPALLLYCQTALRRKKLTRTALMLHFLPALATPFYLYWVCFRHPLDYQAELILEQAIFSAPNAYFLWFLTLKKFVPVIYGALCVYAYLGYRAGKAPAREPRQWLYLFVGFPVLWGWILATHVLGQWLPLAVSDAMGIFSNYMDLTLILALFLRAAQRSPAAVRPTVAEPVLITPAPAPAVVAAQPVATHLQDQQEEQDEQMVALSQKIAQLVEKEKPYLNPQLTLDRLAQLLDLSPRQVSTAINSCFRQNFNGYINRYRVEEARLLLHNPELESLTVMEIAQRAGFSSKATFNRIFKSAVGTSPQAYRQRSSSSHHKFSTANVI